MIDFKLKYEMSVRKNERLMEKVNGQSKKEKRKINNLERKLRGECSARFRALARMFQAETNYKKLIELVSTADTIPNDEKKLIRALYADGVAIEIVAEKFECGLIEAAMIIEGFT